MVSELSQKNDDQGLFYPTYHASAQFYKNGVFLFGCLKSAGFSFVTNLVTIRSLDSEPFECNHALRHDD